MSTCPTNPVVTIEGSRDTGFCLRDTLSPSYSGTTQNQNFSNMANNPHINHSCEEPPEEEEEEEGESESESGAFPLEELDSIDNTNNDDETIPIFAVSDIDEAKKLVAVESVRSNIEIIDSDVRTGAGCHYKPIKF